MYPAFSKRALHSNVPSNLVPSTFLKPCRGEMGLSLVRSLCTPWDALRNKNLRIQTCLRGWYQVRFFGLIFGHSWGNGEGPGWHLARYLPCVSKQCPADGVWRIGRGGSPARVLKTRFTPSESSAGHGSPPQRAPKQCPANGVHKVL